MKTFFVGAFIVVLCAGALAGEEKNMQECLKENQVSEEELTAFSEGKIKPDDVKENMKCSFRCFMVKEGFMDASGKVDEAAILAKHPNHKPTEAALQKCKSVMEANPCDTAFKMTLCMIAEDIKMKQ